MRRPSRPPPLPSGRWDGAKPSRPRRWPGRPRPVHESLAPSLPWLHPGSGAGPRSWHRRRPWWPATSLISPAECRTSEPRFMALPRRSVLIAADQVRDAGPRRHLAGQLPGFVLLAHRQSPGIASPVTGAVVEGRTIPYRPRNRPAMRTPPAHLWRAGQPTSLIRSAASPTQSARFQLCRSVPPAYQWESQV